MFKKSIIIFCLVSLVSCGSQKNYIRTTKTPERKSTSAVVRTSNQESKPSIKTNDSIFKSNVKTNNETQILEATTRVKVTTEMVLAYIEKYKEIAKRDMKLYGIPASIILSQAILESGAGTGPLSVQANNHFGIKCHDDWKGATIKHDDDTADECFRKYDDPSQSFDDHSAFLKNRKWYAGLFKLKKDDYKAWAKGLKAAGYATDVKYPDKLIGLIERYQLNNFDAEVLHNDSQQSDEVPTSNPVVSNNENSYTVIPKDTLYSISKKFNMTIEDLKKLNNLNDNALNVGQVLKIK